MNSKEINPLEAQRTRAKQYAYFREGVIRSFSHPWIIAIVALFSVTFVIVTWKTADEYLPRFTDMVVFIPILTYAARILIFAVLLLLLFGTLYLLGAPRKAKKIDADVASVLGFEAADKDYYKRPFLISSKTVGGSTAHAHEYTFFSKHLSLATWNTPQVRESILWALSANSPNDFEHGPRKHTVVIVAADGAQPKEYATPSDPLFK